MVHQGCLEAEIKEISLVPEKVGLQRKGGVREKF
jgi:hypothetical protein